MPIQSVELLLEPEAERRVLRVWAALDAAGLPSQAHNRAPSNRPHITLVAVSDLPDGAEVRLPAVAGDLPVMGQWGRVVEFGRGPWTVVRLVEPTAGMCALQARAAVVCAVPEDSLTTPARWTAHVTLARRVGDGDLHDVRALVAATMQDSGNGDGGLLVATDLRRWDGAARREWPLTPA